MIVNRLDTVAATAFAALVLVACGDREFPTSTASRAGAAESGGNPSSGITLPDDNVPSKPPAPEQPAAPEEPTNSAPQISGSAPGQATVDEPWSFQPAVYDADGDSLTVSASNLPGWLSIESNSGRISGTPSAADVQTWNGIVVSVSDGVASASLNPFAIDVIPQNVATGSATLSWLPPTMNNDGTPIGQIAGYRLLFGQSSGDYSHSVVIDNPGITTYMIEGLSDGVWYFAIQTVDATGLYSVPSAEASKPI